VAVEFALLLPVLLLLLFGIIDFGRALNAQITLTQAAREGARLAAVGASSTSVTSRTQSAATGLSGVTVTVTSSCPTGAGTGVDAVVQASYPFSFATPVGAIAGMFGTAGFGSTLTLTATGDMPCETLSAAWPGPRCGRCAATSVA
jgi:Flp pilus assembly protein TadG